MKMSRYLMAVAAATMAVAPAVAAPANPAASLSVAKSLRASTATIKGNRLGGENGGLFLALAAGVAIIAAVIIVGSEGSKDPVSP